jgi:hypothetical protein
MESPELSPSLVVAAYLEKVLAGRRTAVLGSSASGLGERLARASGRRAHVYDADPARTAASLAGARGSEHVSFAMLDEALDARAGSFDAVLVDDLGSFEEPRRLLAQAGELLSPRGVLVVLSPNPEQGGGDAPSYYDLYDMLGDGFEHVRMLGQAPFLGCTVVDFAAGGEPAVTIDTSMCERTEDPRWFVAVASHAPLDLDPYVLVQLPSAQGPWLLGDNPASSVDHTRLVEAQLQSSLHAAELERLRERERELGRLSEERRAAAAQMSARLVEVEGELERARRDAERAREGDRRLIEAEERARDAARRVERARAEHDAARVRAEEAHQEEVDRLLERIGELEAQIEAAPPPTQELAPQEVAPEEPVGARTARAFEFQIDELRRALFEARNERDRLANEVERLGATEAALQKALRAHDAERASGGAGQDELEMEIATLEQRLRDRGRVIDELRSELREGERIGRELLGRLQNAEAHAPTDGGGVPAAAVEKELEALAQRCARAEADLEAAGWKITALEARVTDAPADDTHKLEEALREAETELVALRRQIADRS